MAGVVATATSNRTLIEECVNERGLGGRGGLNQPGEVGQPDYRALKASGYRVYPVNHRAQVIDGDPCYPSLASLPERPGVVDVVMPPKIGLQVAEEAAAAGIARIPGSNRGAQSPENVERARELGLDVVHQACALVERRDWKLKWKSEVGSVAPARRCLS